MTIPTRHLIAEIRRILKMDPPTYREVLKWDRNQPRGQKGTHTGGRWIKDVSAGAAGEGAEATAKEHWWDDTAVPPGMEKGGGEAGYDTMLKGRNATGFGNQPRGNAGVQAAVQEARAQEEKAAAVAAGEARQQAVEQQAKVLDTLQNGTVEDSSRHGGNSNGAFIVDFEDSTTKGFYKPELGEAWALSFSNHDINRFVKNKKFSLAERERFAFEVDDAMKLGLVPPTVLRKQVDGVDLSDWGGASGHSDSELEQMYESYKERGQDQAFENVAEQMNEKFEEAQKDHAGELENRIQEIREIWEEEKKAFPDDLEHGSPSAQREHANLPLGSQPGFDRRENAAIRVDPIEALDEAEVDPSRFLRPYEEDKVREFFRKKLEEGHRELGEYDSTAAFEHLDRDEWMQEHEGTEAQLLDEQFQTFGQWKDSHGYAGGGGSDDGNPEAPHPEGGSIQHMMTSASAWGSSSRESQTKAAVLDYVIGTMDRHHNNVMYQNNEIVAIDNGYSMPATSEADGFQFRSDPVVEWLHNKEDIPEDLRKTLHDAVHGTDWKALVDRHPSMNAKERKAFLGRVENMKEALKTPNGLWMLWNSQKLMGYRRQSTPSAGIRLNPERSSERSSERDSYDPDRHTATPDSYDNDDPWADDDE